MATNIREFLRMAVGGGGSARAERSVRGRFADGAGMARLLGGGLAGLDLFDGPVGVFGDEGVLVLGGGF